MRAITTVLLVASSVLLAAGASRSPDPAPQSAILPLRVVIGAEEMPGTCVVVHREDRDRDVVLHFLTSSRLFRSREGEPPAAWSSLRLYFDRSHSVDVQPADTFVAASAMVEIAVFRVITSATNLMPELLDFDVPRSGSAFHVSGYDEENVPHVVDARIRFQSTRFVIGDRDVSSLRGCLGAPAIATAGVFGLVSECRSNHGAVISALSMDRWFIERHLPRTAITRTTFASVGQPLAP